MTNEERDWDNEDDESIFDENKENDEYDEDDDDEDDGTAAAAV